MLECPNRPPKRSGSPLMPQMHLGNHSGIPRRRADAAAMSDDGGSHSRSAFSRFFQRFAHRVGRVHEVAQHVVKDAGVESVDDGRPCFCQRGRRLWRTLKCPEAGASWRGEEVGQLSGCCATPRSSRWHGGQRLKIRSHNQFNLVFVLLPNLLTDETI